MTEAYHLETWDDVDIEIEDPNLSGTPAIVFRWHACPEHQAWVGGGTWQLTPVVMAQDEYEGALKRSGGTGIVHIVKYLTVS